VNSLALKIIDFLAMCWPLLKVAVVLLALGTATVYLFRVRSIKRRWLTVCARVTGTVLVLPTILALLLLLGMAASTSRPRVFVSPDANHIADYSYEAGFLGRDFTVVRVRRKWSVVPDVVYEYQGPSDWTRTRYDG